MTNYSMRSGPTGQHWSAGEQVMEEFHHIVTKPWIERLERVDADTQKALDLDREVLSPPTLPSRPCSNPHRPTYLRT